MNVVTDNLNKPTGQKLILLLYGITFCLDLGYIIWAITTNFSHIVFTAFIRLVLESVLFYLLYYGAKWAKWGLIVLWLATVVVCTILLITTGKEREVIQLVGIVTVAVVYAVLSAVLLAGHYRVNVVP